MDGSGGESSLTVGTEKGRDGEEGVGKLGVRENVADEGVGEMGERQVAAGSGLKEGFGRGFKGKGGREAGVKKGVSRGRADARRRMAEAPVSRMREEEREVRKAC